MEIFQSTLINSPNRDDLFNAKKRDIDFFTWAEALKVTVWYNPETKQGEVYVL